MRWPVILTLLLSITAVGIEQSSAVAQLFPAIAPACGGCGGCFGCRQYRGRLRRMCRRCMRRQCICGMIPQVPLSCAPTCITPRPRIRPRRVVSWEMVPRTTYHREAYCEQVPVTTYRQVVVTVPQTEYRTVMRHRLVPTQIMVPRRRISTVWEQGCAPAYAPPLPSYSSGCCGTTVYPSETVAPGLSTPPVLSVPNAPGLGTPTEQQQKVPAPAADPNFNSSQSSYTPLQTVPTRATPYFEQSVSSDDGYRTLPSVPHTASRSSKFVPAPSITRLR